MTDTRPEMSDMQHAGGDIEMPAPTAWPMLLGLGLTLLGAGVVTNFAASIVGALLSVVAGVGWVRELRPGRGEVAVARVPAEQRPRPIEGIVGRVETLGPGMPGHRASIPIKIHPYTAGIKGGIVGGLVMPVPALAYGLISVHGSIWYPINLLAGMVITVPRLEEFNLPALLLAIMIHAVASVGLGLIYGVLLPTLPEIPRPLAWGGLLTPLLWTGVCYPLMGVVNPTLAGGVEWPAFIASQFLFGIVAALVVLWMHQQRPVVSGVLGGIAGGLVMPIPALLWSLSTGHGVWYPINLLAGLVVAGMDQLPAQDLVAFHSGWLATGLVIHAAMSVGFGLVYGLLVNRLPPISGALAWGGVLMPLLWSGAIYAFMRVLNPALNARVDWPWFIVSQFVYGVAAGMVVERSEKVYVTQPPGTPMRELSEGQQ